MINRTHETHRGETWLLRCGARAAAVVLLAAQFAAGAPLMTVDASESPPTIALPGMSDTVVHDDMNVNDLLDGMSISDSEANSVDSVEPVVQPPPAAERDEGISALAPPPSEPLPALMLEQSTLQADLSVVTGVTLNKIKTMSQPSVVSALAVQPAGVPVQPAVAPQAFAPQSLPLAAPGPSPDETLRPLPDPFPVSSVSPRRHIVDASRSAPARVQSAPPRPAAAPVTVVASRGSTHRVAQGETLADVAALYYRDRNRWVDIYDANRDMIDKGSLQPGQVLAIP